MVEEADAAHTTDSEPERDRHVTELMTDPSAKKIIVLGGPDTGKTTMLERMLAATSVTTAFVDLDLGQSHVGPPAMLAWGYWREEYRSLDEIEPERLFFVGATSPLANPAGAISGAASIVSDAVDHADKVLIDTSGAIAGRFARRLKIEKITSIQPDVIVGLQRTDELEHILADVQRGKLARLMLATIPAKVMSKTVKDRTAYRQRRFAAYFSEGKQKSLSLSGLEVMRFGAAAQTEDPLAALIEGMLVGLVDRVGRHQGMGILKAVDAEAGMLTIFTPVTDQARIAAVIPGRIRVSLNGREQPLPR